MAAGIVLLTASFFLIKNHLNSGQISDAMEIIPRDAMYVLSLDEPIDNWQSFSKSKFWRYLETHPFMEELSADANYLDTLIQENEKLYNFIGNRNAFISAHMVGKTDYDFLFLIDLKKVRGLELGPAFFKTILSKDDYRIQSETYKEKRITIIYSKEDRDELFLTQIDNFLVVSYTDELVLNTIDKHLSGHKSIPLKLTETIRLANNGGLAKLHINYERIDDLISFYLPQDKSIARSLSESFAFSSFAIDLDEDQFSVEGYSSIPDSSAAYTSLLRDYGNTPFEFDKVISSRSAFLIAFGLSDFKSLYTQIIETNLNTDAQSDYSRVKYKVEKILGLSLEKDVLPWIGEEIILAQYQKNKLHPSVKDDIIVAIKADNIDFAREKLGQIQKAIKRRTPAKFKKLKYKTYDIYYLDINGFFQLFFGKAFQNISKPYYTILDDYVVFSNDPKTLVANIEDFENGKTLSEDDQFMKIKSDQPDESAIFVYANGPLSYPILLDKVAGAKRQDFLKSKPHIDFFKGVCITYSVSDEGFKNTILGFFSEEQSTPDISELYPTSIYLEDYSKNISSLSESESFVLNELEDGKFVKYFKGTKQIHLETQTKNNALHGKFKEYYPNGKLRSEGKYRKGKKVGRWRYYDLNGEVTEKKWEGW